MDIEEKFEQAVHHSGKLTQKPGNDELLKLYALYKQATEGDVTGGRPVGFDFKGAAKYDVWLAMKGKGSTECMEEYIIFVNDLHAKYNE